MEEQSDQELPENVTEAEEMPHPRLRLHREFGSVYLPDKRDVIVYVPPGYDEQPERTYPVLHMHDGQNLFDGRTSFVKGRTWQVREHADAAIEAGEVEPLVIVGIYNTGDKRLAEYTQDENQQMGGGEADCYGLMITRELMPWIATQYRVRQERGSTGLGGSSLGGLVSLYLGLRHPECFGKLAVLSPSVWWNHKSIVGYVNEHAPQLWERPRIWLDVGDKEGHKTLRDVELLARRLKANGWRPGENLHFEKVHGGTHDEASWATRVRAMLRFLFPASDSKLA
ncbi:MAG: alpha/beta hydrolase-fold protein [Terracidiphilus sp.]